MSLTQGRRKNQDAGEPLHCPFAVLIQNETFIRKSQLALVAGGPGTGKSAVIQAWLQRGNDNGLRNSTLYFSADSDSSTMFKRAAAIATGYEQTDIERMLEQGNSEGLDTQVTAATAHMRFDYQSAPSEKDILRSVEAYAETYGAYPEALVVDNLKNLFIDGVEGEFQALEQACVFLHELAKDINAAVIALHHVVGDSENGDKPIPLSGIRGKVTKTPEVVLTLHRSTEVLNVSAVKNRNGRADASGNWFQSIRAEMARMAYTG